MDPLRFGLSCIGGVVSSPDGKQNEVKATSFRVSY